MLYLGEVEGGQPRHDADLLGGLLCGQDSGWAVRTETKRAVRVAVKIVMMMITRYGNTIR